MKVLHLCLCSHEALESYNTKEISLYALELCTYATEFSGIIEDFSQKWLKNTSFCSKSDEFIHQSHELCSSCGSISSLLSSLIRRLGHIHHFLKLSCSFSWDYAHEIAFSRGFIFFKCSFVFTNLMNFSRS